MVLADRRYEKLRSPLIIEQVGAMPAAYTPMTDEPSGGSLFISHIVHYVQKPTELWIGGHTKKNKFLLPLSTVTNDGVPIQNLLRKAEKDPCVLTPRKRLPSKEDLQNAALEILSLKRKESGKIHLRLEAERRGLDIGSDTLAGWRALTDSQYCKALEAARVEAQQLETPDFERILRDLDKMREKHPLMAPNAKATALYGVIKKHAAAANMEARELWNYLAALQKTTQPSGRDVKVVSLER